MWKTINWKIFYIFFLQSGIGKVILKIYYAKLDEMQVLCNLNTEKIALKKQFFPF
jgi:hypothetical protein